MHQIKDNWLTFSAHSNAKKSLFPKKIQKRETKKLYITMSITLFSCFFVLCVNQVRLQIFPRMSFKSNEVRACTGRSPQWPVGCYYRVANTLLWMSLVRLVKMTALLLPLMCSGYTFPSPRKFVECPHHWFGSIGCRLMCHMSHPGWSLRWQCVTYPFPLLRCSWKQGSGWSWHGAWVPEGLGIVGRRAWVSKSFDLLSRGDLGGWLWSQEM